MLAHNPEAADVWGRLGDVLALDGREIEAVSAFRRAYELAPESEEYAERLGAFEPTDLLFFTRNAFSDKIVDEKIASFRKEAAKYPQKYTIVYDEGIQQVHYNGSVRSRFRLVISLNTEEGVREFTTVSNYGRIVAARVVKPDGKSVQSWRADADHLYFLDTMPGDVIDFTIEDTKGPRSWIGGTDFRWFFATEGVFNLHSRLLLRFPYDMSVSFFTRGSIHRTERRVAEWKEYLFETRNLYQPPREAAMPPLLDVLPLLSYTTALSWDDFARWQALFVRDQGEGSPEIGRFVSSLVEGVDDPISRVEILRDWTARQVRYLFDDRGIARVRPKSASKTFMEKAGDCKDKAILLKVMLRYAGIESHYALAKSRSSGSLMYDLPSMQFDHALVYIPSQEGVVEGFFVDPTAGYDYFRGINPEIAGTTALIIEEATGGYRFEVIRTPVASTVSLLVGDEGQIHLSLTGAAASSARYRFATDGDPFTSIVNIITRIAGKPVGVEKCVLASGQYAEPFEVTCSVRRFFPVLVAAVLQDLAEPQERQYAIYLGDRISQWSVEIAKFPVTLEPVVVENDFFEWRISPKGYGLVAMLQLKTREVPVERYGSFREAVGEASAIENGLKGMVP